VSVAVGDFRSEADDDAAAREREETKRLVYVALTRARDRLYLGTVLKDGRVQPGRGSLAAVLPPALLETFTAAAAGVPSVAWRPSSGATHAVRVCAAAPDDLPDASTADSSAAAPRQDGVPLPADTDFAPLPDAALPRVSAAAAVARHAPEPAARDRGSSDRLRGTLVHRLIERVGMAVEHDDATLGAIARGLLRRDERLEADAEAIAIVDVVATFRALCQRPDIRALYSRGEVMHELPFAFRADGQFVRGTIDCLVRTPDGRIVVLEFKTGRPRPEHDEQAELYRRAVVAIAPGAAVEARVIYAREEATS